MASALDLFRQTASKGSLTPEYGPIGTPNASRQVGRDWFDPSRMAEREARMERQAMSRGPQQPQTRQQAPQQQSQQQPIFTNATTGIQYFFNPSGPQSGNLRTVGDIEPMVTSFDPRTGMQRQELLSKIDPSLRKQLLPVEPSTLLNMSRGRGTNNARKAFLNGLYSR